MMTTQAQVKEPQPSTDRGPEEHLAWAARWAVLAPSSHNTQPWHFNIHGNRIDVLADRARALPVVDPDDRELIISCGAALFNLRVALEQLGWRPSVEILPDTVNTDVVASVRIVERQAPSTASNALFEAITKRHTNRQPFAEREVDESLVSELQREAHVEGAWLYWARGLYKESVARLIAEDDRLQMADKSFRRELAAWLHPSHAEHGDGMWDTRNAPEIVQHAAPLILRTFDIGGLRAARDHELAIGSPVLAVLGTETDDERAWVASGQALARVLLFATARGLSASFLNQPCEVAPLRQRLREAIGKSGVPQLVLRLGYADPAPAMPRRKLSDVIRHTR
jgi:nitroreductase